MTSVLIFDDVIKKVGFGKQIMHQSRKPVNNFINRHHFTVGIAGSDFDRTPCLGLKILGGGSIYISSILTIAYFF